MEHKPNSRRLFTLLIAIFALGLLSPFVKLEIYGDRAIAQAKGSRPTPYVRVMQFDDKPRVWLEALRADEKFVPSLKCTPPDVIARYPDTPARLQQRGACLTGYMQATVLDAKIANAESSIATLEYLLDLLTKTKNKLATGKTLDKIVLIGIPSIENAAIPIEHATNIALNCVTGSNGAKETEVAIGKVSYINDKGIVRNNEEARATVEKILEANRKITAKIEEETKDGGSIGIWTIMGIINQIMSMQKEMKSTLIAIDSEFLMNEVKTSQLNGVSIGLSFELSRDENGTPITFTEIPKLIGKLLSGAGIGGPFTNSTMIIANEKEVFSYPAPIPENDLIKKLIEEMEERIADLEKKKAEFTAKKKAAEAQLAALEQKNYNCGETFDPKNEK